MNTRLHVVAALVVDAGGRVLLSRRRPGSHQGGLWEFPGGKVEPGESAQQALARELHEELGLVVRRARPLIRVNHDYPGKPVLLDVWRVQDYSGQAHSREGQPIAWVDVIELPARAYPAANLPVVTAARLPPLYVITPEPRNEDDFLCALERILRAGARLLQLRAKTLEMSAHRRLAERVQSMCAGVGATVLLNAPLSLVRETGAGGIHLTSQGLMGLRERPLGGEHWVAASCHTAAELAHACRIGVDFAVVSPVLMTGSHPQARPLGWEGLRNLTEQATVPVYALGGMTPTHLPLAFQSGAQGIAAISAVWDAPDPAKTIRQCLAE